MADKVTRTRTFPHPDLSFLGLVTFAYKISAMMIIHPDANPSPRQEYTKQSKFQKSQTSPTSKATNYHMVPSCLGGAPVCSGALLVAQGDSGCSGGFRVAQVASWSHQGHPGVILESSWVILGFPSASEKFSCGEWWHRKFNFKAPGPGQLLSFDIFWEFLRFDFDRTWTGPRLDLDWILTGAWQLHLTLRSFMVFGVYTLYVHN